MAEEAEVDQQVRSFNESYYRSEPAGYLLCRMQLLMLAGGKRNQLQELLRTGVEFDGMLVTPPVDDSPAEPPTGIDEFVTIESQQLLHHACETALRVFIAHAAPLDVPWVAMSGLRSFSEFKNLLRAEFIDGAPDPGLVGWVCLGDADPPQNITAADWTAAVDGLTAQLKVFAEVIINDANLYNSIKHGLGVAGGNTVVRLNEIQLAAGPSVQYPTSGQWTDNQRRWSLTTRWVNIGESIATVHTAIRIIESIWQIGKQRHLGTGDMSRIHFPDGRTPAFLRHRPPAEQLTHWMLVEEREPPSGN